MSSSPRFWQKLGLGKQQKSYSNSTANSDTISTRSSISTIYNEESTAFENNHNTNKAKRFSTLRHKSSSNSLYQQSISNVPEKHVRRSSSVYPLKRYDSESVMYNMKSNENTIDSFQYLDEPLNQRQSLTKLPTSATYQSHQRRQSFMEISKIPSRLKKPKSNQSLVSVSTATSIGSGSGNTVPNFEIISSPKSGSNSKLRPTKSLTRSESNSSLKSTRKKSLTKIEKSTSSGEDDENKSCLTRSSSNGSTVNLERRSHRKTSSSSSTTTDKKKKKQVQNDEANVFVVDMLKEELEREKSSARALQGQKEAIAKDLDYFCNLVDEVTEERDEFQKKYNNEKNENDLLKRKINDLESKVTNPKVPTIQQEAQTVPQLIQQLEDLQQQMIQEQYVYYNNIQLKNDEINKLKSDLKQAQNQIQILRKTMQQLLKADDDDSPEASDDNTIRRKSEHKDDIENGMQSLLLQAGYHPNQNEDALIDPPSPLPIHSQNDIEESRLFTTSRKSQNIQYEFLNTDAHEDDYLHQLTKRRSEEFSKKTVFPRRRKDQLEEMLDEVDSQLNRAKQKIRSTS